MPWHASLFTAVAVSVLRNSAAQNSSIAVDSMLPPLCGFSKRPLTEDVHRRACLRQCRIESNGRLRPTFEEWETYCRETAGMENWDPSCEAYICCTFGCEVLGGDRTDCLELRGQARFERLVDARADMYALGITQEQRCVLEKCYAYCARASFDTCREMQFVQKCTDSNPTLYGCDVKCNAAVEQARPVLYLAAVAAATLSVCGRLSGT
mmetsp:Transcript_5814/g.11148  ORF Transcript_5814/g.11148 Transcript_5814/m.11148 type:complete len:209 (+) Transcript_5814:54-680(+)